MLGLASIKIEMYEVSIRIIIVSQHAWQLSRAVYCELIRICDRGTVVYVKRHGGKAGTRAQPVANAVREAICSSVAKVWREAVGWRPTGTGQRSMLGVATIGLKLEAVSIRVIIVGQHAWCQGCYSMYRVTVSHCYRRRICLGDRSSHDFQETTSYDGRFFPTSEVSDCIGRIDRN